MKKRVLLLVLAVLALTFVLVSCGHEHDYQQSEVISEATCEAAGKAKFVCECGESEEREIPKKDHTFGEEQVKEPTCWDDGYTYKVCSVCNAESEHTNVVKAGPDHHKFDEIKEVKPDCSKGQDGDGYKETVCSVCHTPDPNGKKETIKAVHDYEEITIEATCSAPGSISQVCKNCSAPGNVTILEQLEHKKESTGSFEATCDEAGYEAFKCTVCNSEWTVPTDEALGHDLKKNENDELVINWCEPTCLLDGYDYYGCNRCDYRERIPGINGVKLGHDIDYDDPDYTVVVVATCITNGSITPICKREACREVLDVEVDDNRESYVRVIDATGIHYVTDKQISAKDATCHEAAYVEYQCTVDDACTATEKRHSGEKLDHQWAQTPTAVIEAKCNAYGYDLYVCTLCEDGATADNTCALGCRSERNIKEVPHKPTVNLTLRDNGVEFIPSTCVKNAYTVWECGDCFEGWTQTYTEEEKPLMKHGIDRDGNDCWLPTETVIAPTCTSEGYTVYYCPNDGLENSSCTATIKKDYTKRTEHPFTVYVDGRMVCSECNVTYRDITTYLDDAVEKGELEIDENTKLDWELKGYEEPDAPKALVTGTATVVYDKTADKIAIVGGVIALSSENEATYTIVIEYADGETVTKTVDTADAYFDLYENIADEEGEYYEENGVGGDITKVTITSTADATVSVYAYEG